MADFNSIDWSQFGDESIDNILAQLDAQESDNELNGEQNEDDNSQTDDNGFESGEDEDEGQGDDDESESQDQEQFVELDGQQIPLSKVRELLAFEEWTNNNGFLGTPQQQANQNPNVGNLPPVGQAPSQVPTAPSEVGYAPGQFVVPEDLEERDQFIIEKIRALEAQTAAYQQMVANIQQQETMSAIERGAASFQAEYNVSDEEMQAIEKKAVESATLVGLVNSGFPIEQATKRSLELALWTDPQFRSKHFQKQVQTKTKTIAENGQRKGKLSSLSSSSSSASFEPGNVDVTTMTPQQRQDAMAQALIELSGN
jgi:hypothetical protein